ncbi:alport syndrome [Wolfiporia cocos MD-104 SS10]|uniref:Alport syndrome n=1 Tax=Wolfiporia cocos (strain MD-104) TaxID=742152 RepID=A0A2H3JYL9_WOLCO|nr:alport syndrome [Wolfiporia cocos MD-104 SS10]
MSLIPPNPVGDEVLVEEDNICTREHCFRSFDALYCALTSHRPLTPRFPDEKYPLFVTWNTRSSRPGRAPRLRGCIGTFEPIPLREGLAEYALISAFQDSRFSKIEERELESLECGISLLTDFEDASSYLDWTIGVHGIRISFPHPSLLPVAPPSPGDAPSPLSSSASVPTRGRLKHSFSATYLPQVAPEQGWDKIETVDSAIRKAGWNGRITEDIRRSVKLRRYQSRKCTVGWEEFVQWRLENGGKM